MSLKPQIPLYLPAVHEDVRPVDTEIFDRLLSGFVPPGVFDVHAHLYTIRGLNPPVELTEAERSCRLDLETYRRTMRLWMGEQAPGDGLFFALPSFAGMDVAAENRFVGAQIPAGGDSRALLLVVPSDDPASVERELESGPFAGFKVYHTFAGRPDTPQAAIGEFLPEWAWELADVHGLAIMLHMVRDHALADEDNQRYIRDHCRRHTGARLILAHAGRGFCARHTVDGIASLRGLENVYFDTSAVCESGAFQAILRVFGTSRLMYGSDWPISNARGRCVSAGDGFFWMHEHTADFDTMPVGQPALVGIESLLALREAATLRDLNDDDVQRIFSGNARELLL